MRKVIAGALLAVLTTLAGCEVLDGAPATLDRSRLIADMLRQLEKGADVRYHADMQIAGGATATVTQEAKPRQVAYRYPGGRLIVANGTYTSCSTNTAGTTRCQPKPIPTTGPEILGGYAEITKRGIATTPVVVDLLRVANLQPAATVEPHDMTLAGAQSTCLEIAGLLEAPALSFTACVTSDGVLASFTGVVNGTSIDQAVVQISSKVPVDAFVVPARAQHPPIRL